MTATDLPKWVSVGAAVAVVRSDGWSRNSYELGTIESITPGGRVNVKMTYGIRAFHLPKWESSLREYGGRKSRHPQPRLVSADNDEIAGIDRRAALDAARHEVNNAADRLTRRDFTQQEADLLVEKIQAWKNLPPE
jgi:hypothetical protein